MSIKYLLGDATYPAGEEGKVIAHVCNNVHKWGKGFVLSLDKRWSEPKNVFLNLDTKLGYVHFVTVEKGIFVANMVAQNGIMSRYNKTPIKYNALSECLKCVYEFSKINNYSVHMPKIGSGLAGGDWNIIEKIIENIFFDTEVYIYERME
jgi:O-acetyl-ADP-ribose deacetylase (regulator of RNase III)